MTSGQILSSSSRRRNITALLLFLACTLACAPAWSAANVAQGSVAEIAKQVDAGQFQAAEALIAAGLALSNLAVEQRRALEFERERMHRILLDFTLDREELLGQLRKDIPDLRAEEFAAWETAGFLEFQVVDGQKRYFNRSRSNVFHVNPAAAARRPTPWNPTIGPLERPHPYHREAVAAAVATGKASVAPRHVRVTYALIVNADAVPAGETVKAWVPFPRSIPGQQEDVQLLASVPAQHLVAPESTLQRTVYVEQPAIAGKPTKFSITYELTVFGQYHALEAAKVVPVTSTPALAPYLAERPPHIVFTPALRRFSRDVVGNETNPLHVAQKLFAAVDRIPWAGAREYSTISNISDYALHAGHADCGQQTLLLMTLLRLNGIPTRWQSGWIYADGDYDNMHDWGWLYLAPYGWVPMDVTFGHLDSPDTRVAQFYLGGLDAYRIAFNDDYSQPLFPPKQHFRSETVDSQRGEVEWRGGNLYFDRWDFEFSAQVMPRAPLAQ